MALTHAGHELLRHAHRILGAVNDAEDALSVRPEALAGELIIGAAPLLTGYYLPGLLERGLGELWDRAGYKRRVTVRTRSVEATRSLVATSYGVSILPEVLFRAWSLDGKQLVAVPLTDAPPPLEIGVVWASRRCSRRDDRGLHHRCSTAWTRRRPSTKSRPWRSRLWIDGIYFSRIEPEIAVSGNSYAEPGFSASFGF